MTGAPSQVGLREASPRFTSCSMNTTLVWGAVFQCDLYSAFFLRKKVKWFTIKHVWNRTVETYFQKTDRQRRVRNHLVWIPDKKFYRTNVFDQSPVQMSRCVGMEENKSLCIWEKHRTLQPVPLNACISVNSILPNGIHGDAGPHLRKSQGKTTEGVPKPYGSRSAQRSKLQQFITVTDRGPQ